MDAICPPASNPHCRGVPTMNWNKPFLPYATFVRIFHHSYRKENQHKVLLPRAHSLFNASINGLIHWGSCQHKALPPVAHSLCNESISELIHWGSYRSLFSSTTTREPHFQYVSLGEGGHFISKLQQYGQSQIIRLIAAEKRRLADRDWRMTIWRHTVQWVYGYSPWCQHSIVSFKMS